MPILHPVLHKINISYTTQQSLRTQYWTINRPKEQPKAIKIVFIQRFHQITIHLLTRHHFLKVYFESWLIYWINLQKIHYRFQNRQQRLMGIF